MPNIHLPAILAATFVVSTWTLPGFNQLAMADVLLIETIQQAPANSIDGILRPGRGLLMSEVERGFGPPKLKHLGVGNPPITRWEYERFSVFFEYDHVVHSVVHRPPQPSG